MAHDTTLENLSPAALLPRIERRRPGRPEHVSPELIPLLRGTEPTSAPDLPGLAQDQLAGMRGLAIALIVSGLLWVVLLRLVF